jgi:hypothetical protein
MTQCAITAAIARKLIGYIADFGDLLINMHLPGIAEVFASELVAGEDRGK